MPPQTSVTREHNRVAYTAAYVGIFFTNTLHKN